MQAVALNLEVQNSSKVYAQTRKKKTIPIMYRSKQYYGNISARMVLSSLSLPTSLGWFHGAYVVASMDRHLFLSKAIA